MADTVTTLDVRNQSCPLPIVRAAQKIKELETGDVLEILATDRGALSDVPSWCDTTGNELLEKGEEDGVFRFLVRKG
jgi:tRNA 2-thiouridine synthesizing protein A